MATRRQSLKDNIATALRTITTENGYGLTVRVVQQGVPPHPRKVSTYPALYIVSGDSELLEREMTNRVRRDELFGIVGYLQGEGADEEMEELLGAIEIALDADKRRGGLAITSWLGSMVPVGQVEGNVAVFEAEIHCMVERTYGQP